MGLNPNLPLIFFGSEGAWAEGEPQIVEQICKWVEKRELIKPCQLLIRPHYSNAEKNTFQKFNNKKHIIVDAYRITNFLNDTWDPNIPETIDFVNSVIHCDVLINTASTLSLDAACADRPIINLAFGCEFHGDKDVTDSFLYGSDFYKWVLDTGAVEKSYSLDELKAQINRYLLNSKLKAGGREKLRQKLCYKVDGGSSERLVAVINDILSKKI